MPVTLDAGAVVMGVFAVLFGIIEIFVMLWIRSVQAGQQESKAVAGNLQKELSALREAVAREYLPRSENRDLRDEFLEGLRDIDKKLTEINNKLDRKQDKQ